MHELNDTQEEISCNRKYRIQLEGYASIFFTKVHTLEVGTMSPLSMLDPKIQANTKMCSFLKSLPLKTPFTRGRFSGNLLTFTNLFS